MKIEEAQATIGKIENWKSKNQRKELAFLRRGPKPENLVNCLSVVSQFVYPSSIENMTLCAEVLSGFVAADCTNGRLGFGTAMSLLVKDHPTYSTRAERVLSAQNVVELAAAIRPVLTLMRRESIGLDYARLLADAANFSAWRSSVIARWSMGFYRGSRAENAQTKAPDEEEAQC